MNEHDIMHKTALKLDFDLYAKKKKTLQIFC
jgi:hypothetical protein